MGNLSDSEIEINSTIYHPVIDSKVGMVIEAVYVIRLVGPSKNPFGYSYIMWSYGNVQFLKGRDFENKERPKTFLKKNCYASVEDCIPFLEEQRKKLIKQEKAKKTQVIAEIADLQKFIKELKKESVEVTRLSNKNVAMLNSLNIEEDLKKKNHIISE